MKSILRIPIIGVLLVLLLAGVVTAEAPGQLMTVQNGIVSGDLSVKAYQPVPFGSQPASGVTSRDFDQAFALPASAKGSNIAWARLYISVYSGSGSGDWPMKTTVTFDGNGDGTYETTLGTELMQGIGYSTDGTVYSLNDHCNRVYSDYLAWYDVTGAVITSSTPAVHIRTEQIGTASYDGRLKAVALVVAYDDGDGDQVRYWVNQGHAWIDAASAPTLTIFGTSSVPAGFTAATLSTLALSSKDGIYTFNSHTLAGADPVSPVNYFEHHTWDVKDYVTAGAGSTHSMGLGTGSTLKMILATLAVRSPAAVVKPVAAFTVDNTTPVTGQTVTFTDQSTNTPTSWAWTIEGTAGTTYQFVDSTSATSQNPHIRFLLAGTYDVSLTATNAGGSDDESKTSYITVTAAVVKPVAAFTVDDTTPVTGQTVTFTDQSTNTPISWAWDFNNDGTTDSTVKNPTHSYATAGTYTVKLTATNAGGSDDEVKTGYITVTVAVVKPVAAFSADDTTPVTGQTVTFTDASTNTPASWAWTVEGTAGTDYQYVESTSATSRNPEVQFLKTGTYDVSLTATNAGGSDDEFKTRYITVTTAATPTIEITLGSSSVALVNVVPGQVATGSTTINVAASNGTSWSVVASDRKTTNKGYMVNGGTRLASPFQLGKDNAVYKELRTDYTNFMSGNTMGSFSAAASLKQPVESGDMKGSYDITVTFTGSIS